MNAQKPLSAGIFLALSTLLALLATGCTQNDDSTGAPAVDTAAAAPAINASIPAEAAGAGKDSAQSPGSMELHRSMAEGQAMPMSTTGDVDRDFASMMTMHHRTAIKMIDVLQQYGQSADLKALAAKMKADQQEEIKKMARSGRTSV